MIAVGWGVEFNGSCVTRRIFECASSVAGVARIYIKHSAKNYSTILCWQYFTESSPFDTQSCD